MPSAVAELLAILDLEQLERNLFRGNSPQVGWQRVFGGQVIGQALVAATPTVEGRGSRTPCTPISCCPATRRCRSSTRSTASATGELHHAPGGRHPARPRDLRDVGLVPGRRGGLRPPGADAATCRRRRCCRARPSIKARVMPRCPSRCARYFERERPIELRPVEFDRYISREPRRAASSVWIRATRPLPDDPAIHQCVLAYASDMTLLDTSPDRPRPHACSTGTSRPRASTMPCGSIGRSGPTNGCSMPRTARALRARAGFARGSIFTRDGTLVASVAQEGLIR